MCCGYEMKIPNIFALSSEPQRSVGHFSIWNAGQLSDVFHTSTLQSHRSTKNKYLSLVYSLNAEADELFLSLLKKSGFS